MEIAAFKDIGWSQLPHYILGLKPDSIFTMDIVQAVSGYITKIVSAGDSTAGTSAAKMKILLLDNETVGLSSLSIGAYSNNA